MQLLHFESGGIYLIDNTTHTARLAYAENAPFSQSETVVEIPVDRPPFSGVLKNEALFIETLAGAYPDEPMPEEIISAAAVPVVYGGDVIGSLNVAAREPHTFTGDERDILRAIGQQLGAALEKMRANDRLKAQEENLHTLFDTIDDFVLILATDGRIIEMNNAIERKLGYSRADLIDKSVYDIRGPYMRNQISGILNELRENKAGTCAITLQTKAGYRSMWSARCGKGRGTGRMSFSGYPGISRSAGAAKKCCATGGPSSMQSTLPQTVSLKSRSTVRRGPMRSRRLSRGWAKPPMQAVSVSSRTIPVPMTPGSPASA